MRAEAECFADPAPSEPCRVDKVVIGLNLCPWAKPAVADNLVNVRVSAAANVDELLDSVRAELERLAPPTCRETTIIVSESLLLDFEEYMDAVDRVHDIISDLSLQGVLQLATFHPQYQFAGTRREDPENWTNRSPFPAFHILQEDEVERALADYTEPKQVWERNIKRMDELGADAMEGLVRACRVRREGGAGESESRES